MEEDRGRASQRNLDGKILRVHKLHEDVHSFQRNRILGRSTRDKGEPDLSGLQHAKHNYAAAGSQVFCPLRMIVFIWRDLCSSAKLFKAAGVLTRPVVFISPVMRLTGSWPESQATPDVCSEPVAYAIKRLRYFPYSEGVISR
jgi:hypothetical protein